MAYVMLYGVGWTQRWQVADESVPVAQAEIERVGREETSHLPVIDPGTGEPTTLVVAWQHVAAAVVLGSGDAEAREDSGSAGQYR
jgi:hypothetical protein